MELVERVEGSTFLLGGWRLAQGLGIAQRGLPVRQVCQELTQRANELPGYPAAQAAATAVLAVHCPRPKLRVVWMPRPPLACAFVPIAAVCPVYLRRVSGMAAPMSSKAWRCWLVGSVRTGTVAGVPAKRSSLRVRVPRWASSPRKLR